MNKYKKNLALRTERHLRPVAVMIEVPSRHPECTLFYLDYSYMPAIALQW